ncbi:hypothetical protein [Thermococcus thioreducens]|uniref:Uncharacterized protein n=3 Tax=Thermococcus thioreducens TaxID=277988 RepID=A0A1I0P1R3_9EURY|nr:hypothetical protein [Thermococcus thioreducens]SEW08124.1 hypothetical protein SAMN05216170_1448 [Thermococcus thioreducens]
MAGMEFLGGLAAILWLAWLFLPLFKIDSVLIFLKELTEDLKLKESPIKALSMVLIPPLSIVMWYHVIFGIHVVILIAIILFISSQQNSGGSKIWRKKK